MAYLITSDFCTWEGRDDNTMFWPQETCPDGEKHGHPLEDISEWNHCPYCGALLVLWRKTGSPDCGDGLPLNTIENTLKDCSTCKYESFPTKSFVCSTCEPTTDDFDTVSNWRESK